MRNCMAATRCLRGKEKGVEGGAPGLYIGGGFLAKGVRVARREAMDGSGSSRAGAGLLPEEEGGPGRWSRVVSDGSGYRFGAGACWAGAGFSVWAEMDPEACFLFSDFLYSFLFSGFPSCFIYFANLIQINSNKNLECSIVHCSVLNQ
jgi:hypothetical protein